MISPLQSSNPQYFQQRQRARFNPRSQNGIRDTTTSKSRHALVSPLPPVDHDTYSTPSKSLKASSKISATSADDEHLFSRSKSKLSQGHILPVVPSSKVYPTVSTLPRLQSTGAPFSGSDQPPSGYKTQYHALPRHESTSIPDSTTTHPIKPNSVTAINSSNVRVAPMPLSRVDTAETRKRDHRTSTTRTVIKSSSRNTMDSSKASSSSSGALSSKDGQLLRSSLTNSRSDHKEVGDHMKRRRAGEDIKLKPIREVEIGNQRIQNNKTSTSSQLPSRPPGLGSNRNSATSSTGVKVPVTSPIPTSTTSSRHAEIVLHSQTKRLSQILARPSVVVLSPPSDHVDRRRSDEILVDEKKNDQVNTQGDGRRGSLDVTEDTTEGTLTHGPRDVGKCLEEETDGSEGVSVVGGVAGEQQEEPKFLSLTLYLSDAERLSGLLRYLSFSDWCGLYNASKEIRLMISQNELLKEEVLERYLGEVGYSRWCWRVRERIPISLSDMFYYLKNASIPTRSYVEVAQRFFKSSDEDDGLVSEIARLAQATRSHNRLVLRLRAQSEMLEYCDTLSCSDSNSTSPSSRRSSYQRVPDIAGSTSSFISSSAGRSQGNRHYNSSPSDNSSFSSPLYRPNRAVLLRVFVPSPQGEWLSDDSVLECEVELKRAEITRFMRLGDVVWDVALGDEKGNSGKLIWDGCYLLDLDYTYTSTGDVPRHIPSLALPPSYFHGVIQRGPLNVDPIIRMDVSPWGEEIARNLQLMQDRMVAKTPQGLQNVVRWVHRTTFSISPPSIRTTTTSPGSRMPAVRWAQTGIAIRDSNGQSVHPSWYGSIVIETDGTNECLDDLKERCGLGVFPKKAVASGGPQKRRERHEGMVWRILRDRSRPGEIWVKVITPRERLM